MLIDVSPLSRNRDFRLVYIGQTVSAFGSFLTYVALPVQIYGLTKSSASVGLLSAVELVPLALAALWGGALADALDRRCLLLWCEALLLGGCRRRTYPLSRRCPPWSTRRLRSQGRRLREFALPRSVCRLPSAWMQ
jgi:hypothetical protein